MVITNTTNLSAEEALDSLVKVSKRNFYSRFIFASFLAIAGILIVTIVSLNGNGTDTLVLGFMFITFGLIFFLMNFISILRIPKNVKKKNADILENGMENQFIFKEESFHLTIKIGSKATKLESSYDVLRRIVEYEDRILFMLSNTEIFICKKDGFSSPKELEQFFYGLSKHKTKIKKKIKLQN